MEIKRLLLHGIGVVSLAVMVFVAVRPAYAKADVVRFSFESTFSDTGGSTECLSPELVGTVNATEIVTGQIVDMDPGFHVYATTNLDYRVDFPDGSYILGSAVEHFTFNINSLGSQTISTVAIQEPRTIYTAYGQPIGKVRIHFLSHLTYNDANGNGQPDADEITASVEAFRFTCYS